MEKIKQIWKNRTNIFNGIWNTVFKKAYIEKISAERMKICNACPSIDLEGKNCITPGLQPCCSFCGCTLAFKTRDLNSGCGNVASPKWNPIISKC